MNTVTELLMTTRAISSPADSAIIAAMADPPDTTNKRLRYIPSPIYKCDRNAQCPCNSGRKFKKCCINKVPEKSEIINDDVDADAIKDAPTNT